MAWIDIPDSALDPESELRDDAVDGSVFLQLRNNINAWYQGLTGAPKLTGPAWKDNTFNADRFALLSITGDLFEDGSIGPTSIIASSVRQGHLDRDYGELTTYGYAGMGTQMVLNPGGYQMLGYESKYYETPTGTEYYRFGFPGLSGYLNTAAVTASNMDNAYPSIQSWLYMECQGNYSATLRVYFLNASPPYAINGRECALFCYLRLDASGRPVASWTSPAPPWVYNGPTQATPDLVAGGRRWKVHARGVDRTPTADTARLRSRVAAKRKAASELQAHKDRIDGALAEVIRLNEAGELPNSERRRLRLALRAQWRSALAKVYDIEELTPEVKNADMPLLPQPFGPRPQIVRSGGLQTVLLDPSSAMAQELATLHRSREVTLADLLAGEYVELVGEVAGAPSPPGVPAVSLRWKDSRV